MHAIKGRREVRVWELPTNYTTLTQAQRREVRLQYVTRQSGNCAHCAESLNGPPASHVQSKRVNARRFPPRFFDHPVHLHHCHTSGLTIGAVHAHCNAVLWQYYGE